MLFRRSHNPTVSLWPHWFGFWSCCHLTGDQDQVLNPLAFHFFPRMTRFSLFFFFFLLGANPETNVSHLTFLLPVKFCAKEMTSVSCPVFSESLAGHRCVQQPQLLPLIVSLLLRTSQASGEALGYIWAEGLWLLGVGDRACECTGATEPCCCSCSDFGELTVLLGSVCIVTDIIVMISLLTMTFLSNVWINTYWYKRVFVFR